MRDKRQSQGKRGRAGSWVVGWGLVVVLGVWPGRALGTSVIELSFKQLVQEAELILVGTVMAMSAEWEAESETSYTLVTFSQLEVLKGDEGRSEVTLQVMGGPTPEGETLELVGTPQFRLGERAVVFSAGNGRDAVPLVGLWQGVYRLRYDGERQEEAVYNHAGQPVSEVPTSGGRIMHDGEWDEAEAGEPREAMTLPQFQAQIKEALVDGNAE